MRDVWEMKPVSGSIRGRVRPPGSKSITNRALICAAMAEGNSTLMGALDSDDTRVMIDGLGRLGIEVASSDEGKQLVMRGTSGRIPALEADLFCGNSGTTIRFLTALATLGHGSFRLDGIERMRERPIGDLLDALGQLGAHAESENGNGCPPVVVHANGLPGGVARIRGNISSQFLSGLLMAAPAAQSPVELHIEGALVSQPYVRMTMEVMKSFGIAVETDKRLSHFRIAAPLPYRACEYAIEPDASAASYFWAAAAITGGEVTVDGLSADSLQGDVAFVECLERMGCGVRRDADSITVTGHALHGIDVGMNAISDTVQTLSVVAMFAAGPTRIRHVGHIRHKETDRISALATELRKLGVAVTEHEDGLTVEAVGEKELHGATIETYRDHRMAMSFALAALRIPDVRINDPGCVDKTYPRYFDDLATLVG
ncbi:MAG TPA: 3-phosphoshikimate 1-carboxyvinyltransferase [Lacipirellulaceae bacterium]|nr:3-phosphoshikimate 1-carboxyvinyltransferase [Lacipirellulaceae bacterium]